MLSLGLPLVAPLLAGVIGLTGANVAAPAATPAAIPAATASQGVASVGALFPTDDATGDHDCTASVVDSTTRDLIVTAAHCVTGTGAGMTFVPDYANGQAPYGIWHVTAAYATPGRLGDAAGADDDVVILRVAPQEVDGVLRSVQQVTGGAELADTPDDGTPVTVIGYADGSNDEPMTCTVPLENTATAPTFACSGYVGGTSGSPFLATEADGTADVVGVIGGQNQGGCVDWTSYSPVFGSQVQALLTRAESGAKGDNLPAAGGDGC